MLPFLLLLAILGLAAIRDLVRRLRSHRALTAALVSAGLAAALLAQGALYLSDMYGAYPGRAAAAFGAGVEAAIAQTPPLAAGHTVYLSATFEQPYIQAFFALRPPPPPRPVVDDAGPGLRFLHMVVADPGTADGTAGAGDLLVLDAGDPTPQPASVFPVVITEPSGGDVLVRVFRAS
jgi:hypothetical protein